MQSIEKLFLFPGRLVVTRDAMEISTILGSCVSVCFFDPVRLFAGMNHFLLPVNDKSGSEIEKYGDTSLEFMLDKLAKLGSNHMDLVAKVFGGADTLSRHNSNFNIGEKNISLALDFISDHKIKIISRSVGGKVGRKVIFNTHTGIVNHRYLTSSELPK
jgi:chemotaxis protein CheD